MAHAAQTWAALEQLHLDYLVQVVEQMDLCPFARRSRELGRVHRPMFALKRAVSKPELVAEALAAQLERSPAAEIVLLTFVGELDHPLQDPAQFEIFLRQLREAYSPRSHDDGFYMVSFHPGSGHGAKALTSPDSLVSRQRQCPDPVIQCVRARVLDQVRAQANANLHVRMLDELEERFGPMAQGLRETVLATPPQNHLSAQIAQRNFERWGPQGRAQALVDALAGLRARRLALEPALQAALRAPLPEHIIGL